MFSRLSPLTIFCATAVVAVGELASGTKPEFVLAVIVIMICVGVTFNLLDGLTSLAGILYTEFALRGIVISQFVKVALFERADKNLEVPYLTIMLYAVFYACVMVSVFIFSRFRFPVPKPLEPVSDSHAGKLYVISLIVGSIATVAWDASEMNPNRVHTAGRPIAQYLAGLLLFAAVIAIDRRIRNTAGKHSLGWDAVVPIVLLQISSLVGTSRESFLAPVMVYFVCAFARGYHFQRRHFIFAGAFGLLFYFVVSPLFLYNRAEETGQYFSDRVLTSLRTLSETQGRTSITAAREVYDDDTSYRFNYYSGNVGDVLNRFALVRPDSDLISACSGGYHYGWTTIKHDFLFSLPHVLYPNKPQNDSYAFTGHLAGLNDEWEVDPESTVTAIADSYGGFGVLGVVLFGLFGLPILLIVYRSAFDITKPWGIVALGGTVTNFGEWLVGRTLINAVELPLMLFAISLFVGTVALLIPTRGDNLGRDTRALGPFNEDPAAADAMR